MNSWPSGVVVDFVNRADVRMVERRGGLGFLQSAARARRHRGSALGEELQRDGPVEPRVDGLVDHAHAAAAEPLSDAVVRDSATFQRGASYWRASLW